MQLAPLNNYNDIIVTFVMGLIFLVFGIKFLLARRKILDALLGSKTTPGRQLNENTARMVSGLLIPFIGVIITMGGLVQIVHAIISVMGIKK